jgi:hypothetical protein
LAGYADKTVDTYSLRDIIREGDLVEGAIHAGGRHADEVFEGRNAEPGDPFDQVMQHIGRRENIRVGPVTRLVGAAQIPREGLETVVGHLAGKDLARETCGIDHLVVEPGVSAPGTGGVQEADVETGVVSDDDRALDEFQEARQDRLDLGGLDQGLVGDARQEPDERRDVAARVDQGLEGAGDLAHLDLAGAYLGYRAGSRGTSRSLQVQDTEGDIGQGRTQFLEGPLYLHGGGRYRTYVR